MTLRALTWGKEPIYYVQKSYRKEDGKNATKNVERLGTLADLKARFGEEDPIGAAKKYIVELTAAEKEANKVPAEDLLRAGAGLHLQEDSEEAQAG